MSQYKDYVDKLIFAVQKKTIRESEGAILGLIRGISDYDEILYNIGIDTKAEYSWGKITSEYDSRSNISSINIIYN